MNVFISTFLGWGFFIAAVVVCSFFVTLSVWRILATGEEYLAKRKQRKEEGKQNTDSDNVPVLLSPKDRREYMLNHIEDGRLYAISTFFDKEFTIVCAKRYDAEEQRLYCYAYLLTNGEGAYNLHVIDPRGIFKLRDFLGGKSLRIDYDRTPALVVFEEEYISPYISERDYNDFVLSLQKAGVECEIEKGEDNGLGSCKYQLKETRTK